MTQLDHSKLKIGVQPYYGYQVFSCNNHTITTGSDGDNALVPLPSGSSFFVYLTRKVNPGIADVTYFGGVIECNLNRREVRYLERWQDIFRAPMPTSSST